MKLQRKAMLFNENGKWKYDVHLKYQTSDKNDSNMWGCAERALQRATEEGSSLVTMKEIPPRWFMIVKNPFSIYSHPICVYGKAKNYGEPE